MDIGQLVFAFFNEPGPGGGVVIGVLLLACVTYVLLTRWIIAGGKEEE